MSEWDARTSLIEKVLDRCAPLEMTGEQQQKAEALGGRFVDALDAVLALFDKENNDE